MTPVMTPFDPADYLDSEEMIAQYLTEVATEGDADEMAEAIAHVSRARRQKNPSSRKILPAISS